MDSPERIPLMARTAARPDFSVIVPCFEEADTLEEFHARLSEALDALPHSFEIVYVNDGSRDGTRSILRALFDRDPRIGRVVDLAANCGQNYALSAGIQYAEGENLILMDCDLQIDPKDMGRLLASFDPDTDMVSGMRERRRDALIRRIVSSLGNRVVSSLSGIPMRDLGSGLKLIRGSLVRAFDVSPYQPLDPGTVIACLRKVVEIPVSHQPRRHGRSRWTLRRFLTLYHNVITNFLPVLYPLAVGTLILVMCVLFALFGLAAVFPSLVPWTANPVAPPLLMTVHMILTLALLFMVGAFTLRSRFAMTGPAYIVREVWSRPAESAQAAPEILPGPSAAGARVSSS